MQESLLRMALLLKSANSESELGSYGHHATNHTIDPHCPEDQKYIKQAQDLMELDIDYL